jgi:hypothetical protein
MRCVFNPRRQITPLVFGLSPLSSLKFIIQRLLRAFTSFLHGYPPRHSVFVALVLGAFHTFCVSHLFSWPRDGAFFCPFSLFGKQLSLKVSVGFCLDIS